jgi:hypothetical protein
MYTGNLYHLHDLATQAVSFKKYMHPPLPLPEEEGKKYPNHRSWGGKMVRDKKCMRGSEKGSEGQTQLQYV